MTEVNRPKPFEVPDLSPTLRRLCGQIDDVTPSFRLLRASNAADGERAYEFFSRQIDAHVIVIESAGNIAREHATLKESSTLSNNIFPDLQAGQETLLLVPEGARSFASLLGGFAKDVRTYGEAFRQFGYTLEQLERGKQGLPSQDKLLESLAWAPNPAAPSGGSVFLVPPYNLDFSGTAEATVGQLQAELTESDRFDQRDIAMLIEMVEDGRHRI